MLLTPYCNDWTSDFWTSDFWTSGLLITPHSSLLTPNSILSSPAFSVLRGQARLRRR